MNKFYAIIFIIACVLLVGSVSAFSGSGSGTVGDPYQITTCTQLHETANSMSSYYKLMNNIDCINYGNFTQIPGSFSGQWNGDGYAIENLYTAKPSTNYNEASAIFAEAFYATNHQEFTHIIFYNCTSESFFSSASYGTVALISGSANGWGSGSIPNMSFVYFDRCHLKMPSTGYTYGFGGLLWGTSWTGYSAYHIDDVGVYNSTMNTIGGSSTIRAAALVAEHNYELVQNRVFAWSTINSAGAGAKSIGQLQGGTQYGSWTCTNSFFDNQQSTPTTSGCGTGETTASMKTQGTYTGWTFSSNHWKMSDGGSAWAGYPIFDSSGYFGTATIAPVASFTKDKTGGTSPVTVVFTDTSSNTPTSWYWVFGDGSSVNATLQSPVHTFTGAGTYNVNLTATNTGGSSTTATQAITVGDAPVASFTKDKTGGVNPCTVQFTDTSTGTPTLTYYWVFGDGSSVNATQQNPVHTFSGAGTYNVNVTVTNSYGTSQSATQAISVGVSLTAAFTKDKTGGANPCTVQFTDTSTNTPISWYWVFGDGNTSTAHNPDYTYVDAGSFDANLTATNMYGSDTAAVQTIDAYMVPNFAGSPTNGLQPLSVAFTDTTTGHPDAWFWDFGDGNGSVLQNPTYVYPDPGTYTVNLTVHRSGAADENISKTDYIIVSDDIPRNFGILPNITDHTIVLPYHGSQDVSFTPTWTGGTPTIFRWISTGWQSMNQTRIDTYDGSQFAPDLGGPGLHTINLSMANGNTTLPIFSQWKNITYYTSGMSPVMINQSLAPYITPSGSGYPGVTVAFGAGSDYDIGGRPETFRFDFGDGTPIVYRQSLYLSIFRQYEVHTYAAAGTYDVKIYGNNTWGTSIPVHITYTVLPNPGQHPATMRWADVNGNTITTAQTGDTGYIAFDTVNTGVNPPLNTNLHMDGFYLLYYYLDKNTNQWINGTTSSQWNYVPFTAQRDDLSYSTGTEVTLAYGGHSWKGSAPIVLAMPTTYRAYLVGFNMTADPGNPQKLYVYGSTNIVVSGEPIPLDQTGQTAQDFGGAAFKLVIAIIVVILALAVPYLITREINIYVETIAVVLGIGLCAFAGLLEMWEIFGLGIAAVAVIVFMWKGGGGSMPEGGGEEAG
jgi:PKD repeat protein